MMSDKLFKALNDVDEELLIQCDEPIKTVSKFKVIASVAAVIAIVTCSVLVIGNLNSGDKNALVPMSAGSTVSEKVNTSP